MHKYIFQNISNIMDPNEPAIQHVVIDLTNDLNEDQQWLIKEDLELINDDERRIIKEQHCIQDEEMCMEEEQWLLIEEQQCWNPHGSLG